MARMRWLIGLLSLGVFSQAQSRRAAILLTGHVRTFDLTAPTLDEFLGLRVDEADQSATCSPCRAILRGRIELLDALKMPHGFTETSTLVS